MTRIRFTLHARERLAARKISISSVEAVLSEPLWTEPDPVDAALTRAFGHSDDSGELLRVVFRVIEEGEMLVVTAHLDRAATRKWTLR